ncbi:MAG: hypothetical protein HYX27_23705 [Acidobacteria bacterium]|nr:hypothetical protein [Acidobacteriota bacterium]
MGYEAKKTEHNGPKRGKGAYWGRKREAKKQSNKIRRENGKSEIGDTLAASSGKEQSTASGPPSAESR